ncbi:MAG: hypothetical protein JWR72_3887 [Flavisolibacter sp.]|nr:hypothetical protein [Flavisolibacter sp.]
MALFKRKFFQNNITGFIGLNQVTFYEQFKI